jgi:hypothetical protein
MLARIAEFSHNRWQLLRVAIVALENDIFIGRMFFGDAATGTVMWDCDCRPSDGLYLSLRVRPGSAQRNLADPTEAARRVQAVLLSLCRRGAPSLWRGKCGRRRPCPSAYRRSTCSRCTRRNGQQLCSNSNRRKRTRIPVRSKVRPASMAPRRLRVLGGAVDRRRSNLRQAQLMVARPARPVSTT